MRRVDSFALPGDAYQHLLQEKPGAPTLAGPTIMEDEDPFPPLRLVGTDPDVELINKELVMVAALEARSLPLF